MNIYRSLSFLIILYSSVLYADNFTYNKESMKDYVLSHCRLDNANDCDCLANRMLDSFTEKDWYIFRAAVNKDESIKKIVTDKEIFNFSDKLYNTVLDCGIE